MKGKHVLIILVLCLGLACSSGVSGPVESRFIQHYENVGKILADNADNADKAYNSLNSYLKTNLTDYIEVTNQVNALDDDGKKGFVENYGTRLSDGFDLYWGIWDKAVGKDERVLELLNQIPNLDIMAFNKYFTQD